MAFTKKQVEKIEELGWDVVEEKRINNEIYAYKLSKKTRCGSSFYIVISYEAPLEALEGYVEFFDVKEIEEDLKKIVKELREL